MKKIIFFSFFFILSINASIAAENKPLYKSTGCSNVISENYFLNADKIKKLGKIVKTNLTKSKFLTIFTHRIYIQFL